MLFQYPPKEPFQAPVSYFVSIANANLSERANVVFFLLWKIRFKYQAIKLPFSPLGADLTGLN